MPHGVPSKNRWRFDVISPITNEVEWSCVAKTVAEVVKKWKKDKGNNFLSKGKVVRATTGESSNPFIKCYKVGKWATRDARFARDIEDPITRSISPTPSEASCLDDYSTSGETDYDTEFTETDYDTEVAEDSDGTVDGGDD